MYSFTTEDESQQNITICDNFSVNYDINVSAIPSLKNAIDKSDINTILHKSAKRTLANQYKNLLQTGNVLNP